MSNPSDPIAVVLIGRPANDPALNLDDPNAPKLLSAYERSRSEADRLALPLLPGQKPALFTLKPLSAAGVRFVKESPVDEVRAQRAVLVACHEFKDERGIDHKAADHGRLVEVDKRFVVASDEWLDHLLETFGNAAIAELAAVVLQRAEAGPRATTPFRLPRGSFLPV